MSEPAGQVLPIYFVADESGSMAQNVSELNTGLVSLLDALQSETMAASKVRFSVIGFDDSVRCHLPMVDLRDIEQMPTLSANGSTSFAAAFNDLQQRIPSDASQLKGAGYQVNRPAVFFLTDGEPNPGDGWETARQTLMGMPQRPNVLAFGIGQANAETIRQVATSPEYAFIAAAGVDTGKAIAEFIRALTQSVISSGQALADGRAELPIEKPDGFVNLAVDLI